MYPLISAHARPNFPDLDIGFHYKHGEAIILWIYQVLIRK
jgi:hypothetical protein